jgi:hypothetical protein
MLRLLGKRVAVVQKFQAMPYKLTTDKVAVAYLQNLYYTDDDEILYQLS